MVSRLHKPTQPPAERKKMKSRPQRVKKPPKSEKDEKLVPADF